MIIDNWNTLVREQNPKGDPGNLGDSMAESSWYVHLKWLLGEYSNDIDLNVFITDQGFLRHPESIWREDDMSGDNLRPYFLASRATAHPSHIHAKSHLMQRWYRTGNGKLITPSFYAHLHDKQWLLDWSVEGQTMLFDLPYRWSDQHHWFERNVDKSGDYMNFLHDSIYCKQSVRDLMPKRVLKEKVLMYYKPEPNSDWLIDLNYRVIDKYWSR